jgi:hypothetical protein
MVSSALSRTETRKPVDKWSLAELQDLTPEIIGADTAREP